MKFVVILFTFIFSLIYSYNANAIIFIPAVILIPIAKILAVLAAGFSAPTILTGAIVGKAAKRPVMQTVLIAVGLLILILILVGLFLKLSNPERPIL